MIVETRIDVGFAEIDKMGIVHNSVYPMWFEKGRRKFLKKTGISDSSTIAHGLFLPLIRMECSYKSPARFGDKLVIRTEMTEVTNVRVIFEYRILNRKGGKLVAMGKTVHAWTDKSLTPLNVEKTVPELYSRLRQLTVSDNIVVWQE